MSTDRTSSPPPLGVWGAILAGWLFVNLPAVFIMLAVLVIGAAAAPRVWGLFLLAGGLLGWAWWSYTIPRWRRWALGRGAPAGRLQKAAVATGLTWPKGWVFEKTEAKVDE